MVLGQPIHSIKSEYSQKRRIKSRQKYCQSGLAVIKAGRWIS
jgi:hypothetical protein